jgi:hypothetical protein
LLVYVEEQTGAALAVALLLFAGDCLPGFIGPVAGAIGDRFDLRRVMIGCELLQRALVVAMAVALPRDCSRSPTSAASCSSTQPPSLCRLCCCHGCRRCHRQPPMRRCSRTPGRVSRISGPPGWCG